MQTFLLLEFLFLFFVALLIVAVDADDALGGTGPDGDVNTPPAYIPIQKDKWAMQFNDAEPFTFENLNFFFNLEVSTWIQPGQAHLELYTSPECKDGGPSGLPGSGSLQTLGFENQHSIIDVVDPVSIPWTDTANFQKDGKAISVPIRLNKEIANNAEVYETYVDSAGLSQARAQFCARISLRTLDPVNPMEANFMEHLITLDFLFSPIGFTLITGASVIAADKTNAADRNDENPYDACCGGGIEGYLCDPTDGTPVDPTTTIFKQGELIHACVKPIQQALDDGVVMSSIKEFTWTRDSVDTNGEAADLSQTAIANRAEATNALSFYSPTDCWRQPYCTFNTFLASPFFFDGSVMISGTGSANMIYLGGTVEGAYNRERELVELPVTFTIRKHTNQLTNKNGRVLSAAEQQERRTQDDASNEGAFDLQVQLEGTTAQVFGQASSGGSDVSSMKTVMMLLTSCAGLLLLRS